MNHRTARNLVGLLVAVALGTTVIIAPVCAGTIAGISVNPSTRAAGATNVSYTVTFTLPLGSSGLDSGEAVTITFPSGFDVSKVSQTSGSVTCTHYEYWDGGVTQVVVSGQEVRVFLSRGLAPGFSATIAFLSTAQIANPLTADVYTFSIAAPHDTGSGVVTIGTGGDSGTGTVGSGGVTSVLAIVDPARSGKAGGFDVGFTIAQGADLTFGQSDYVDITFPPGSTVPSSIPSGSIKISYLDVTSMETSGTRLRLFIPASLGVVFGGSPCSILITVAANILLPTIPGTAYTLIVATSNQPNGSSSGPFQVYGTSVTETTLAVNPPQQGTTALYDLRFTVSPTGGLASGTDKVTLTFPSGTIVPATIAATAVRVNDNASGGVSVNGLNLVITTPVSVSGGSTLRIAVNPEAGVRSPSVVGSHQLFVSTSQDTAPVAVSFSLTASQISTPVVQVSTGAAGQAASYAVTFATGPGGSLVAGIDRINVEFPAGTTIPSLFPASSVTVGVSPSTYVSAAGMVVSVTVPVSIDAGVQVTLTFAELAGIRHPVTGGTYVLRVSTSRETASVTSSSYAVSSVPVVSVSISPATPDGLHGYYRTKPIIVLTAQSAVDAQPVISYRFDTNADSVYGGQPLTALEGSHTLTYYAMDRLGSRSETGTLTIAVDSTPPVIAVLAPLDGATVNGPTIAVRGTVDVGSSATINGQSAVVDATGAFNQNITIQGNTATIVIDAIDVAGNTAVRTLRVTVDKTPPALTLSQPVNFQKIQRLPIIVAGKTEVGAAVTVQGSAVTVLADGSFEYSIGSAVDGPLTITVVATDGAGNVTTRTAAVTVQSTKLIQMQVGTATALVNGQSVALQTAPIIRNSVTLVPLRFVAETFGISPVWDGIFQIIDLPLGTRTVRLQIGQRFAAIDGKRVGLDAAPIIMGGVTMIPLRFIADTLGADTQWEAATSTIIIVYPRAS